MDAIAVPVGPGNPLALAGKARVDASYPALRPWLQTQTINLSRHAHALRPFRPGEFGSGPASPSQAHIVAANSLILALQRPLLATLRPAQAAAAAALEARTTESLQRVMAHKERAGNLTMLAEGVWDFFYDMFVQRLSIFAVPLLGCDRIAADCYEALYTGLGRSRAFPSPLPFSFLDMGFTPATYRRGIPLRRLHRHPNPFPLIKIPYVRLINPWTLGAILHEVAHNLQADAGLWDTLPLAIKERLRKEGLDQSITAVWKRWHKEVFADLCGLLLGGPAVAGSLMDVVARSPRSTLHFNPSGVHPTPYLRPFISFELLRRLGLDREAESYQRIWTAVYPDPAAGTIPQRILETFPLATRAVVDTVACRSYPQLGGKSLRQVVSFRSEDQRAIEEGARRLAAGLDPGVLPARFFIGVARVALQRQLAPPGSIAQSFYRVLARR